MVVQTSAETILHIRDMQRTLDIWGFKSSEIRTRYAVIDPILRSLGWDLGNPAECRLEWRIGQTDDRVDYALCALNKGGSPTLPAAQVLLEAKKWEQHLWYPEYKQIKDYLENYPNFKGIGILTNGREWQLYQMRDDTGQAAWSGMIRIREGTCEEAASKLGQWLARSNWN